MEFADFVRIVNMFSDAWAIIVAYTAAYDEFMQSIALVTLSTIPEEQEQWVAEQALNILDGVSPSEIPIVQNKK